MKHIASAILTLLSCKMCAQFGAAGSCELNVNNPTYENVPYRNPVIDATFMWLFGDGGQCSATLVNRNTSNDDVGFYFITARHCVSTSPSDSSPTVDFSLDQQLIFNYQSPDANNSDVPGANQGSSTSFGMTSNTSYQSNLYPWSTDSYYPYPVNYGYEYQHVSKVRLVDRFFWGDFALCEILTPLPPHFNITYSSWPFNHSLTSI